jgi:sodium-dependent dicarboxylate transporter 2/3/5
VSLAAGISPVVSAILVAVCSSLDFMLPVGTPPNAIAYSTGKVKVREMVRAGLLLDIVGALVTIIFALTFWPLIS